MKAKHLLLTIATLLTVGGLWLAWRTHGLRKSSMDVVGFKTRFESNPPSGGQPHADAAASTIMPATQENRGGNESGRPNPGQMPRPPVANRRVTGIPPEKKGQVAGKGERPRGEKENNPPTPQHPTINKE